MVRVWKFQKTGGLTQWRLSMGPAIGPSCHRLYGWPTGVSQIGWFPHFSYFFQPMGSVWFLSSMQKRSMFGLRTFLSHRIPWGPGEFRRVWPGSLAAAQPSRSGRGLLLNLQRFYLAGFDLKPMETGDDGLEHGFYDFPTTYGNVIIPTDFHSIILQRGSYTTNQESLVPDFNSPIDPARDAEGVWLPLMVLFVLCVLCVLFIWILGKF